MIISEHKIKMYSANTLGVNSQRYELNRSRDEALKNNLEWLYYLPGLLFLFFLRQIEKFYNK